MSRENVEIVRRLYEAWARGDFTHAEAYDPAVRYRRFMQDEAAGVGLSGEWDGIEGLVRGGLLWIDAWDDLRVEAEEFLDVGDKVVALTRQRGQARTSGIPLDQRMADVWQIRDKRVVALDSYWNRHEALEAVGLRE